MNISQEDAILILKNLYLSKRYGARRLLSAFSDNVWKIGSVDSLLKRIRKTGTMSISNRACVHRGAVDDLVLSRDKPKRQRSAREILHETVISPFKCAQDNLP